MSRSGGSARSSPDAPEDLAVSWPDFLGSRETAEEIVLHVITETATHAGQLDVVRESIDGKTWLVLD